MGDKRTAPVPPRRVVARERVSLPTTGRTARPQPTTPGAAPDASPLTRERVPTRDRGVKPHATVETVHRASRPHAAVTPRGTTARDSVTAPVSSPKGTTARPVNVTTGERSSRTSPSLTVSTSTRESVPHATVERPVTRQPSRPTTVTPRAGTTGGTAAAGVGVGGYGAPVPRRAVNRPPLRVSDL